MATITITPGHTYGASDTVTSTNLNNLGSPTAALTAGSILTADIADSNVTTAKIADANVTFAKLANVIDDDTMATASATTLATSESIKAYVDELIDYSALPSHTDGLATKGEQGSYTLPSGLIIKYGTLNSTASAISYTFTTEFPTAIIGVNATVNESISTSSETCSVSATTKTGFNLLGYRGTSGSSVGRVFWTAYGY